VAIAWQDVRQLEVATLASSPASAIASRPPSCPSTPTIRLKHLDSP
jgi:hypothetical protein